MTPDDICSEQAEAQKHIQIRTFETDDSIVIEGDAEGLLFLSKIIAAQVTAPSHSFSLSPHGAGSTWFKAGSTKGIYIHRLPCQ